MDGSRFIETDITILKFCAIDLLFFNKSSRKSLTLKEVIMARITVEDCIDKVPNRFDLVLLAAHRAREISLGAELTVDRDKDKNPVVALREIADETLTADQIREAAIESNQLQIEIDEPEEDQMSMLMGADGTDDSPDPEEEISEENLLRALMEAQESK